MFDTILLMISRNFDKKKNLLSNWITWRKGDLKRIVNYGWNNLTQIKIC